MDQPITEREIYLTKRFRVILDEGSDECPVSVVATLGKNLESLGFIPSKALFERLRTLSAEEVARFYGEVVPILAAMVGAHRQFEPMYPDFPAQVMAASDLELYVNALAHYWGSFVADLTGRTGYVILPRYPKTERDALQDEVRLRVIDLGSPADFERIFTGLIGANSSISERDKAILAWFVENYGDDLLRLTPGDIPQKENLALLAGLLLNRTEPMFLLPQLKTATDVLRVAAVMSGGDVSLAAPTKFRKFSRRERRFFLRALEGCDEIAEDMLRWKGYWIRLGEILHPSEYKDRYPRVHEAFDILRNDRPFATFNAKVEAGLNGKDLGPTIELLRQRPGVFARRLDHLLRLGGGQEAVDAFLLVADRVATPVLVQVFQHFKTRPEGRSLRAFFPKGNVAKVQVREGALPPLPDDLPALVADGVRGILVRRFGALSPLGKVRVDDSLKSYLVPFAMRSASKALRTIARGSRIDLPEANTIRFFLWWKNGDERADIDLSALFFSTDWARLGQVAYFNLRESDFGCFHSGDIVDAPDGACEFIDLDRNAMLANGIRYAVMCLNSFTSQPYCDLPECFAGWMARETPQSGEVFEARTVQDKIDLASDTTVSLPVIIDLEQSQVIWTDVALRSSGWINNVRATGDNIARLARAMATLDRPNLYDLFLMHAEARGEPAPSDRADTLFSAHEGLTPFDTDKILSEFLA
ncbi:hypothetical protein SAMN05444166_1703 [Singulisphaera sp. GP187]|uniref:TerD family protein n=1 Tax=Singulisphaera sp. GP187 TaxID=1882752 RepID=UPI00092A2BDB|nr:TerD family protein [Singulisphaera sp. GP187]SIN93953.1 hypothetical protein SAMN05444166_1703 [Singulisphaera sp. GP187]